MMTVGRFKVRSHMTLEYEFTGIRIFDESLIPVTWKLTANLIAPQQKKGSRTEAEYNAGMAYQRLYFWLETNLPNIMMVDTCNEIGVFIAGASANSMMYCPDEPVDEIIIQMLHSKLAALAGKTLVVGEMTLKGSDVTSVYNFDCPDNVYDLPQLVNEYVDGIVMHEKPWWTRNDGFSFEFVKPEEYEEISTDEFFSGIEDPMLEFEEMIKESVPVHDIENAPKIEKEPAKIVQVEKWKPKIVK